MVSTKKTAPASGGVNAYIGRWRIVSMECWDAAYFDMEAAAHIIIREDLLGEFQFGLVQGQMKGHVTGSRGWGSTRTIPYRGGVGYGLTAIGPKGRSSSISGISRNWWCGGGD